MGQINREWGRDGEKMKVKSLVIKNYKGIKNKRIELGEEVTCIKSENGSGKSRILECLCLGIEMGLYYKTKTLKDYNWPYFNPHEILRRDTRIELNIELLKEEIDKYKEVGQIWRSIYNKSRKVLNKEEDIWRDKIGELDFKKCKRSFFLVFQGGYLNNYEHIKSCSNVFRYNQYNHLINQIRTGYFIEDLESLGHERIDKKYVPQLLKVNQYEVVDNMEDRERNIVLNKWFDKKDYENIDRLNELFKRSIQEDISMEYIDQYRNIIFNKCNIRYPIEDLSYGERRVFNILYKIINNQISNSIIVIDEIGLSLDTKRAKSFLSVLKGLNNNQIIYSTNREDII